jgi:hypothetical protein
VRKRKIPDSHKTPEVGSPRYRTWEQVAGYFDGDGSVSLAVVKRVLRFRLRFVDRWKPQVEAIRAFMIQRGIRPTSVNRDNKNDPRSGYRVEVGSIVDVLSVAKSMLPFCMKKAADLAITIDYLEDKITGDEAVARFNEEVLSGRRSGIIRKSDQPFTRSVGLRASKLENAAKARRAYAVKVDQSTQEQIRSDHLEGKMGWYRLSRKYGLSVSVIRRILRFG